MSVNYEGVQGNKESLFALLYSLIIIICSLLYISNSNIELRAEIQVV